MGQATIENAGGVAVAKPPNLASHKALADKSAASGKSSQASLNQSLLNATTDGAIWNIKRLVDAGADIEARDSEGMTPLLIAAWLGNRKACVFLLERGANIEAVDSRGWTALMCAANWLKKGTLVLLFMKGAKMDTISKTGKTALMLAVGAGANMVNKEGKELFRLLISMESIKGSMGSERFREFQSNLIGCMGQ
jgi:ankyrin repeat protein